MTTNSHQECVGYISSKYELIPAGTTIYSMPISISKRESDEYERCAKSYGIRFIFDDCIPNVDFYTIPRVDIAATADGGFIGMIGGTFDSTSSNMICYIDRDMRVFNICRADRFISAASHWRELLSPCSDVKIFASKTDAAKEVTFIEI
ncbi:MAG: hypothetical protein HFE63_00635 [Clostridiales bacterium]|nr:hypothetical protein [Clostridiales bacterium]